MQYKKISIELIVPADEATAVVAELNSTLDQMEDRFTLFGGEIETAPCKHSKTRKRSALAHTLAAGDTVVNALGTARRGVATAIRAVI